MARRTSTRRQLLATCATTLGVVTAGCSELEDPPTGGEGEVTEIVVGPDGEQTFEPDATTVAPEATVRWVWDSGGHTVVPVSSPDTEGWTGVTSQREAGFTFEESFEVVGTYEYTCDVHDGMDGVVTVEA